MENGFGSGAYLVLILVHLSTFSCILVHFGHFLLAAQKSIFPILLAERRSYTLLDSNQ